MAKNKSSKSVESFTHEEAKRKNIPTAEFRSVMHEEELTPIEVAYQRRNKDLDPQLVWRGKDQQDWSDLVVQAPPLYIQEKIHPKVLIDDLARRSKKAEEEAQLDLFSDFNGLPHPEAKTEFYQHDANWTNRMILGDSLQVMASLAEREGLRGKVQCIYFDPPYGIKFNSNFQWSTTSRDVKDGKSEHITREPEQVKAFRDTWKDGIHSYLTYLRDRLLVAKDLLTDSGSIFLQIGDENVHKVRVVLDEVFGAENFISTISFRTKSPLRQNYLGNVSDFIIWYSKDYNNLKFRKLFKEKIIGGSSRYNFIQLPNGQKRKLSKSERENISKIPVGSRLFVAENFLSAGSTASCIFEFDFQKQSFFPGRGRSWKTNKEGMERLLKEDRLIAPQSSLYWISYVDDYPVVELSNNWFDTQGESDKSYVVQTSAKVIQRCLIMSTDPGDLVLDPTCGSGTTAYVAEQWGRRWITMDTSRVALALARTRVMGSRFPYYLLSDSKEGQQKEAEISQTATSTLPTQGNIRQGFVYERVPHITLKSLANNAEIDEIWEQWQEKLEPLRQKLNEQLGEKWEEWEIPRDPQENWSEETKQTHEAWWKARIAHQKEIDASIAAKADFEYLYDKPYEDKNKVRVAGPFTVESMSPHRVLGMDENDELIDPLAQEAAAEYSEQQGFVQLILENLRTAGVQQAHKEDKIMFESVEPWPGEMVCAEGKYLQTNPDDPENQKTKRAGIFIGPEFGSVNRPDLVQAAREAADGGFDVLISCAFNYEAHATGLNNLGRVQILRARMNADLHMADDLKNTGKGNLFVIFGEPDVDIEHVNENQIQVKVNGVDVFDPRTGEIRSDNADGIACWFIDTDYNEESFFVRHAYFLGANDPYKSLKTSLKAEINREAWETLHSDTSRPFDKPENGRIAVKVINHLGDEVMKVFRV